MGRWTTGSVSCLFCIKSAPEMAILQSRVGYVSKNDGRLSSHFGSLLLSAPRVSKAGELHCMCPVQAPRAYVQAQMLRRNRVCTNQPPVPNVPPEKLWHIKAWISEGDLWYLVQRQQDTLSPLSCEVWPSWIRLVCPAHLTDARSD